MRSRSLSCGKPLSKEILLGSFYRPPNGSDFLDVEFMSSFENVLEVANAEMKEVIVMDCNVMDFNCNCIRCQGETRKLKSIFQSMNMTQVVNEPTRVTRESQTLLDIVRTSQPQNITSVKVVNSALTDHDITAFVRKLNSLKFKPQTIQCRNYSKYCAARFNNKLSSVSWDNVSECQDVNDAWLNFRTSFSRVVDNHTPQIEKKFRGRNTPWLSNTIKKVMAERDDFYRQARRTNTELHWSRYKRNQVTAMIRKAKSSYNRRIIEESFDDPKNFWKAVKKVLPNKLITPQPSASIEPITVDGKTTTDALIIANGFCTYFATVVEELLSNVPTLIRNQLSEEACLNNSSQSLFSLKPVSAAFVNRQLRLLKTSKSTTLDGIPARLLKDVASSISALLTAIINLSISSAVVSEEWKYARVVPPI